MSNPAVAGAHRYVVAVREVHIQPVRVWAKSAEEAKHKVADGEGTYESSYYLETQDPETWTVLGGK